MGLRCGCCENKRNGKPERHLKEGIARFGNRLQGIEKKVQRSPSGFSLDPKRNVNLLTEMAFLLKNQAGILFVGGFGREI